MKNNSLLETVSSFSFAEHLYLTPLEESLNPKPQNPVADRLLKSTVQLDYAQPQRLR